MTEEQVTKNIIAWLKNNNWEIVCFDFPQSGTGRFLHPNNSVKKNKDAIIPDIVAVKNDICIFLENKDRFYLLDYEKQNKLITQNNYTDAINELLYSYNVRSIYYGIGLPTEKYKDAAIQNKTLVDFIIGVNENNSIEILYDKYSKL